MQAAEAIAIAERSFDLALQQGLTVPHEGLKPRAEVNDRWLTATQVAGWLCLSKSTVKTWIQLGDLEVVAFPPNQQPSGGTSGYHQITEKALRDFAYWEYPEQ